MTKQVRDWNKDKRYLEELNEWDQDPDDEDLFKIASHWHLEAKKWREEALRKYPTPESYEAACEALHKHRERADIAELDRDRNYMWYRRANEKLQAAEAREKKLRELLNDALGCMIIFAGFDNEHVTRIANEFRSLYPSLYPKEEEAK